MNNEEMRKMWEAAANESILPMKSAKPMTRDEHLALIKSGPIDSKQQPKPKTPKVDPYVLTGPPEKGNSKVDPYVSSGPKEKPPLQDKIYNNPRKNENK